MDHGIEGSVLSKSSTARMFLTENPLLLRGCEATSPSVESMLERSSSTFDCTAGISSVRLFTKLPQVLHVEGLTDVHYQCKKYRIINYFSCIRSVSSFNELSYYLYL